MINNLPTIIFLAIIAIGYAAFILITNFEILYYLQIKEYRIDRILQGLKYKNWPLLLVIWTICLIVSLFSLTGYTATPNGQNLILYLMALAFPIYAYYKIISVVRGYKFTRPALSIRNIIIILPTLLITLFGLTLPLTLNFFLSTLSIEVFENITNEYGTLWPGFYIVTTLNLFFIWISILLTIVLTSLTAPLAWLRRQRIINQAKQIIANQKKLKVVAITGSYGKTSTKEILAKILRTKYTTQTTLNNFNTAVGVAKSVISELKDKKVDIFISEMGAYRPGEIRDATKVTPPDISVITNIGKAHIDLYGSVDNIKVAKFEIMQGLKEGGTGIFNANNIESHSLIQKFGGQKLVFSSNGYENTDIEISNVKWDGFDVGFDVGFGGKSKIMQTTLIGKQLINNLFAAITVALKLGMSLDEIAKVLKKSTFQSSHFKIKKNKKFVLIDDSYNANPVGVDEALEYLKSLDFENKVLITKGILEMDTELDLIYKNLAKNIVLSATKVITTDKRLWNAILNLESDVEAELCKDENQFKIAIENIPNKNTAVLVSGRIHKKYIKTLEKHAN